MKNPDLKSVHEFWNSESCGERYAVGKDDVDKFFAEEKSRYSLEPYIKSFGEFEKFQDKNVLEIGVGYGCDHSQIAKNKPSKLTGVDLTERAIENTKYRFHILDLNSTLKTDNAENLSFQTENFDAVYSWGVLHHSPDTNKCFKEVHRVLKPGGVAKIMIYHKYSPVGWMLWLKYGLLARNPFKKMNDIYSNHLESPGTKAYTLNQAKELVSDFSEYDIKIQLSFADLLEGDVGARHRGLVLEMGKFLYPRFLIKLLAKILPIGLFILITARK